METRFRERRALLSALAANAAAGTLFAWSVLLPSLGSDLDLPPGRLGPVFSTALVVFALGVLLGGGTVDRQGPRRVLLVAGALSAAGLGLSASASALLTLHLGIGVLFGAGSGLTYLSTVTWASTRVVGRRDRVTGLVVAAYAAGPVVAAPLATWGIDRLGWRAMLLLAGILVPGVVLLAARALPGPLSTAQAAGATPRSRDGVGDTGALLALWLLFFGTAVPALLVFAYATEIAVERGVSAGAAGVVVASMAAGNLAGRLLAASLTARLGAGSALWAVVGALVVAVSALTWSPGVTTTVLALPVVTLQYGLMSALLPGATGRVSGELRFGAAYGRVFSSFGAAAVAGPALGSLLHDGEAGYARSFEGALVAAAVAVAALVVYRRRLRSTT
jgi:OFA family oxalate/formate antiporter-like MFS transporter